VSKNSYGNFFLKPKLVTRITQGKIGGESKRSGNDGELKAARAAEIHIKRDGESI